MLFCRILSKLLITSILKGWTLVCNNVGLCHSPGVPFLVKIPLHFGVTPVTVLGTTGIAFCVSDEESKRKGLVWPAWDPKQFSIEEKRWRICKSVSVWLCNITDGSLIFSVLINFGVVSVLIGKCEMLRSIGLHCICQVFCSLCAGVEPMQVQETVENHLKSLLIKHFDPRKADSIFTEEGEVCMESLLLSLRWILPRCLHLMEWWMVGEGKLNPQSSLVEEQLVSENQLCLTGVLRGLENLEIWNAASFVRKLCRRTCWTRER